MIAESFPNAGSRYVEPGRRKEPGHLKGYDPETAPRFARRPAETGKLDEPPK